MAPNIIGLLNNSPLGMIWQATDRLMRYQEGPSKVAYPGRIIYLHPQRQDGLQYFYVIYYPQRQSFSVRFGLDGRKYQHEGQAGEIVAQLEQELGPAGLNAAAIPAATAVRREVEGE